MNGGQHPMWNGDERRLGSTYNEDQVTRIAEEAAELAVTRMLERLGIINDAKELATVRDDLAFLRSMRVETTATAKAALRFGIWLAFIALGLAAAYGLKMAVLDALPKH